MYGWVQHVHKGTSNWKEVLEGQHESVLEELPAAGPSRGGRGQCRQPLRAGKGKDMGLPLETPEETIPADTLTLALGDEGGTSELYDCKARNPWCLKLLISWQLFIALTETGNVDKNRNEVTGHVLPPQAEGGLRTVLDKGQLHLETPGLKALAPKRSGGRTGWHGSK